MMLFDVGMEKEYEAEDVILGRLKETETKSDGAFTSQRWLKDSLAKRMMFYHVYGELLSQRGERKRILDVGGGYTSLTKVILQYHDYTLLDIMAHCPHEQLRSIERASGKMFWKNCDWYAFDISSTYDLVVANDLFPNVDQRLSLFMEKFMPACRELRITLTYYNSPRWYKVKRIDGDEIYHMLAWDGADVRHVLEGYVDRICGPELDLLLRNPPSLFANGRQVCLVIMKGGCGDSR